jgi:hypothetical protein
MKIATRLKLAVATLAMFVAPCAYGQTMPANTPEAKKAAAQLSQPAGPTQVTPDQQTDRTTVPGYTPNSTVDTSTKPRQPLYENSAVAGGSRDMSMNGMQRDSGATAASGPRGEIGVWLTANGGQGVRVGRLARDGAADRAGLKSGDIILQVNGNGVASPSATAQLIRQVPIGQTATLTVVRDGEQKQIQVTLMPARQGQQYQVGYGGDEGSHRSERSAMETDSGGLAARTSRLEQQIESMTEEMRQMRQQMASMRANGSATGGTGAESGAGIGTTPSATSPAPSSATPPQSGAASTTPSSTATPISTPTSSTSPAAGGPSTPSAPPTVGSSKSNEDLFGNTPSSSSSSPASGTSK